MDPAGGVENPVAPDRDATSLREGFPHLLGRALPAHSLRRPDGGHSEYTIDGPPLCVPGRREVGRSMPARSRSGCEGPPVSMPPWWRRTGKIVSLMGQLAPTNAVIWKFR